MIETLRWLPGIICGIIWVLLNSLVQPWLSSLGILLYTDALFVIIPTLFMPMRPAFITVLLCTFFADALRASPFGLSASILLPALVFLHFFQNKVYLWPRWTWVALAAGINVVAWAVFASVLFWTSSPALSVAVTIKAAVCGGGASTVFILALGFWFFAFQLSAFKIIKKDLFAEMKSKQ
ncbi:MAG: hypothetical protein LBV12_12120 [Puniceicoccales bacterium]|jgi:hypothetical protein|nr:hypothetical protein [Puniceicoccales bacterium]